CEFCSSRATGGSTTTSLLFVLTGALNSTSIVPDGTTSAPTFCASSTTFFAREIRFAVVPLFLPRVAIHHLRSMKQVACPHGSRSCFIAARRRGARGGAELRGRLAGEVLERAAEMTLVREAGSEGDVRDRRVGLGELPACDLDPHA